jgi:hypothetical protein
MPNERFARNDRKVATVQCWFCLDHEGRETHYGFIAVSGVMAPACEECASKGKPDFSLARWVGDSVRHTIQCSAGRTARQLRPRLYLRREGKEKP